MNSKPAVLVTGGEELGVLAAVRALSAGGYRVVVAASHSAGYATRSRLASETVLVPSPRENDSRFVGAIAEAARSTSVDAVLPGTEACLLALAGQERLFGEDVLLACPSHEVAARATDKETIAQLAGWAGLLTPPTTLVSKTGIHARAGFPFPAVVKPVRSLLADSESTKKVYGVRRVSSRKELAEALEALPEKQGLVQPYLPGRLTALAGVFWEGKIVAPVHFAASRTWPPDCGLISYATTILRDSGLETAASKLLGELGWRGIFQMQFVDDDERRHHLIDFNPRIFASLPLPIAAGANLPKIWMDLLLGRGRHRPERGGYQIGVHYRSEERDFLALAYQLTHGSALGAVGGLLPRRNTTHSVFSTADPFPVLTLFGKALRLWINRGRL